jgi:hypothetical protein
MPRYTITWEARPLDENGLPMGSTITGQEDADFEVPPEGTVTEPFKVAKAEHLLLETGKTYDIRIVRYREVTAEAE